jgi:outer membrane biosynthesis protein TonB
VGRAEGGIGSTTYSTAPADGGLPRSALAPIGEEPEITALGYQPILEAGDLEVTSPSDGDNAFTVLEVDSAIVRDPASAAPEYPPHLLQGGIEGSAAVRFVVDSTGEVDILTYRVLKTTHSDFAVSVRRALPLMHFKPAVYAGKRVRQLVEQSFSFRISPQDGVTRPQPIPPS